MPRVGSQHLSLICTWTSSSHARVREAKGVAVKPKLKATVRPLQGLLRKSPGFEKKELAEYKIGEDGRSQRPRFAEVQRRLSAAEA